VLSDGPSKPKAFVGGGAPAELVHNDEAALRCRLEHAGRFDHFQHEGGDASLLVIAGADSGDDAVCDRDYYYMPSEPRLIVSKLSKTRIAYYVVV